MYEWLRTSRDRQDHRQGPGASRPAASSGRPPSPPTASPSSSRAPSTWSATYTINDERKQKISFAGPYFIAGQDLLVKATPRSPGRRGWTAHCSCSVTGSTPAKLIRTRPEGQAPASSHCTGACRCWRTARWTRHHRRHHPGRLRQQEQYAGKFKVVGKPFSEGVLRDRPEEGRQGRLREGQRDNFKAAASDGSYKAAWDSTLGKSGKAAPELDTTKLPRQRRLQESGAGAPRSAGPGPSRRGRPAPESTDARVR